MADNFPDIFGPAEKTPFPDIFDKPEASVNMLEGVTASPDQAVKQRQIGKETGIPPALVDQDVEQTHRFNQAQDIMGQVPTISDFVAKDPENAKLIHDDLGPLADFTEKFLPLFQYGYEGGAFGKNQPVGVGARSAIKANELGRKGYELQYRRQLGMDTEGTLKSVRDLELGMKNFPQNPGIIQKVGGLIGGIVDNISQSLPAVLAGIGVGAVAGGPAGAGAGAGIGVMTGIAGDAAKVQMGHTYLSLDKVKDEAGNPLPESVKVLGSGVAGVGTALLNMIGIRHVGNFTDKVLNEAVTNGIVAASKNETYRQVMARAGRQMLESAAVGGGIMSAQEVTNTIAETIGKVSGGFLNEETVKSILNDPQQMTEFVGRTISGFADGALLFGLMRLPAAGTNMVADMARISDSRTRQAQFDAAFEAANATKTRERDPSILKEYMEGVTNDKVSIPVDAVEQLYAGADLADPNGPLGYIPDLAQQVESARLHGGDVVVSVPDYFAHTAPEVHTVLSEHVRQNPEAMTPAEAMEVEGSLSVVEQPPKDQTTVVQAEQMLADNAERAKTATPEELAAIAEHNAQLEQHIAENREAPVPRAAEIPVERDPVIHQDLTQAIDVQRKALWLDPMFERGSVKDKTPNALRMTQQEFQLYSLHLQEVQRRITEGVYQAVEKEVNRREQKLWKDAVKNEIDAVEPELRQDPVHMADWAIRAGENPQGEKIPSMKLDPNAVDVMMGGDVKFREGLSDNLFSYSREGFHPDELASMFGFGSGKEMLQALHNLEKSRQDAGKSPKRFFDDLVKQEAGKRVEQKLGKLDERVAKEALDAALDTKQIDVMLDEMKKLGADQRVTQKAILELVQSAHQKMPLIDARKVSHFENLVGRYGRQAEMALLKGDHAAAFMAKQRQLMNFMMAKEAAKFDRAMTQLQRTIEQFTENRSVKTVDQAYTDRIQYILKQIDVPGGRSDLNIENALGSKTLSMFVDEKMGEGREVYVADYLTKDTPPALENMTANEALELKKTLDSLKFHGMKEKMLEVEGKKAEFEEVRDRIVQNVVDSQNGKEVDFKNHGQWTVKKGMKGLTRWADASMLKMEQLFQWIDKRDPLGPMNTYIFRPLKEAQHWKDDMMKKISKDFLALRDKDIQKRKNELVPNNVLLDKKGRPEKLTRGNMLAIMLNMGNEGNFQVLTRGRKWDPNDLHQWVMDNATEAEWKFVQGVWNITGKLWPEVERVTKATTGVAVEKVQARSIQTPHGTFKGGYYPLIRDTREAKDPASLRTQDVFDNRFFNPFTSSSATKERTGSTYPLNLTLDRLPGTIRQLVHDLAFREPMAQAQKLIRDEKILDAITESYGSEYKATLLPWLQYIANDGPARDINTENFFEKLYVEARVNAVTMMIGFKVSTSLIHGGAALANSIGEIGLKDFSVAVAKLTGDRITGQNRLKKEALDQSGELRNRAHNLDRDIGIAMDKMMAKPTARRKFQTYATALVAGLDQATAIPTFMAARDKALMDGKSLQDAIYIGDQAVRNAHGAQGLLDLSPAARSQAFKGFTMFYGYFNHNYNRLRDTGRLYKEGEYAKAVWQTMAYLVWPAIIHELVRPHSGEDDTWGGIAAKAMVTQLTGTLPIVRDAAFYAMQGYGSDSPLAGLITTPVRAGKDLYKAVHDGEEPVNWVKHFAETPGWMYGFSTKTMASAAQVGYDVFEGNIDTDEINWWAMFKDMRHQSKDH